MYSEKGRPRVLDIVSFKDRPVETLFCITMRSRSGTILKTDYVQYPRSALLGIHKITFPYKINELIQAFLSAVVAFL